MLEKRILGFLGVLLVILFGTMLFFSGDPFSFSIAHENQHHKLKNEQVRRDDEDATKKASDQIVQKYSHSVKSIFEAKCFDCHSSRTHYPWYYRLPGAKQLIDRDIREARKHLDMTLDFPFKGHSTPREDLEAIAKAVNRGTMPPWRYILMHSDLRLTDEEKETILEWIKFALQSFDGITPENP